jgi:LmbE family N-acetylglucosaminyl deacetylase
VADYHTKAHGTAAHYLKASVVTDLVEILRDRKPQTIYTTDEADTHLDHRATFWYVRDAAKQAGFQGKLFSFIVHGRPPADSTAVRIKLTPEELAKKRAIIEIYQAGVSPVHDYLANEYAREEEVFWDRSDAVRP